MDPSFSSLAWTVCFLTLLITSSHYDNDHSSFESDHAYVSSKYKQQQRQMNTTILELKTILASPPKNLKRKLLHSVAKYTKNGVSTFNPRILELEIFKAWDVNPNPGPAASNDKKNRKANCAFAYLCQEMVSCKLGQWTINNLKDTKLEQIQLLLTANHHEIDVLFLLETFLKPNKPDCVLQIPSCTFFQERSTGFEERRRNSRLYR